LFVYPAFLIRIPKQSAIIVGFVIGSSTYCHIRLHRLFLAASISSLPWNPNHLFFLFISQRRELFFRHAEEMGDFMDDGNFDLLL